MGALSSGTNRTNRCNVRLADWVRGTDVLMWGSSYSVLGFQFCTYIISAHARNRIPQKDGKVYIGVAQCLTCILGTSCFRYIFKLYIDVPNVLNVLRNNRNQLRST